MFSRLPEKNREQHVRLKWLSKYIRKQSSGRGVVCFRKTLGWCMLLFRQGLVSHLQRMMMSGFCQGCIFPSSDSVRLIFAASSSYLIVFLLFRSNISSQMFRRPHSFNFFILHAYLLPLIPRVSTIQDLFYLGIHLKSLFLAINRYYFPGNQILIRFPILPLKHEVLLRLKLSGKLSKLYTVHQSCVCTSHASAWYLRHFGHLHPFWQFSWMTSLINRICFSSYRFVLDISTKREARNCSFLNRYVRSHVNILLVIWM